MIRSLVFILLATVFFICFCPSANATQIKKALPDIENKIPSVADAPGVFTLNSSVINESFDKYVPVRFMHRKHANVLQDCTVCHHRVLFNEKDNTQNSTKDSVKNKSFMDTTKKIYGKKVSMKDLTDINKIPTKCSSCHNKPFKPEYPDIPGLKGAYHQRCMNCHTQAVQVSNNRGPVKYTAMVMGSVAHSMKSKAPTDCLGCHEGKVPDHSKLVKFKGKVTAKKVTAECLRCHENAGKEILDTSHWKWQGPSPYSVGNEKRIDLGKSGKIFNNFCVNLNGNWSSCTGCHIGYGWEDQSFDFNDMSNIDCLVCHDRTEWHEYTKTSAGWPAEDVDLKTAAENVGRPQRANCGMQCHFFGGHGGGTKHGALTPVLDEIEEPSKYCDVHMGGDNNFKCQDCHTTRNHKIAGRSLSVSVCEGDMSCAYCHTDKPHINTSLLSHHLNKHTDSIACQTCHIPIFSKSISTEVLWDWAAMDEHNEDLHHGKRVRVRAGQPTYMWYNGTAHNYIMGDLINENGPTNITKPMGDFNDSSAKIFPFKPHSGKQVYDAVNRYLLPYQLWKGVVIHHDWDRAIRDGVKSTNLKYSGKYAFEETIMYQTITHEVLPQDRALACNQCHTSFKDSGGNNDCSKCHEKKEGVDFKAMVSKGIDFKKLLSDGLPVKELIGKSDYINFKALGYKGDPVEVGGRFSKLPLLENKADKK